jgi:hypothetical protein
MNRFNAAVPVAFALVLAALVPAEASAQPRPLQQVLDLNRQAMDAYNNLEIEQAQSLLQQALDAATRGHVTGSPLARTYVNLGIVAIAGTGDNGAGLNYFIQALQADGSVALDPLLSTPDIQSIWTAAHSRVSTAPVVQDTPPSSSGGPVGDLVHQPVPEQLRQTPVPVYVEVPGRPAHVYLYYRGHGMRDFERAEMDHVGRGYGFEIPCGDVFEPEVNYYIAVFDTSGSPISFAGSQSAPISVPIVATRTTSAPALPGRAPPTQCTSMEEECPPGMPSCHSASGTHGTRGLGDSCHSDADCASGNCDEDLCALGDGGHDDHGGGGEPDNGAPRFFARVSGGVGASYVGPGLSADRTPCQAGLSDMSVADCSTTSQPNPLPAGTTSGTYSHFAANPHLYGYDDSALNPPAGGGGGTCGRDGTGRDPYCFYVDQPGMVANFSLRLDIGYYIVPRWLAVALMARFQPISGNGTLSFMQIGARLETELTEPVPVGFHVHLFVGGGAGQVQVFLSRTSDTNAFAPWGTAGLGYVDFGSTVGYRFMRNFGIQLQPVFVFAFGNSFMFTLDVLAGIEVGF